MYITNDPLADFDAYCDEKQRELDKLPKCYDCGEPIQTEYCYEFNGEYICHNCLIDNHRKYVNDFIE